MRINQIASRKAPLRFRKAPLAVSAFALCGAVLISSAPNVGRAATAPAQGTSVLADRIRANGKLRAGVIVAPPNLMEDPATGRYYGPAIDIANRVAQVLGVQVQLVDTSWDVAVAGLQAGKYDINVAPMFATERRRGVVTFVNYTSQGMCYFARKDDTRLTDVSDINKAGIRLLVQTGTSPAETAAKTFPNATILRKTQPPGGGQFYEDILTRRADVAPIESNYATAVATAQPGIKIIPAVAECVNNPPARAEIGVTLLKNDPTFAAFLASVVAELRQSPRNGK